MKCRKKLYDMIDDATRQNIVTTTTGEVTRRYPTTAENVIRRSSSRSIKRPKFDDELVDTGPGDNLRRSQKISESSSDAKPRKAPGRQVSTRKRAVKLKANPVPSDFGRWRPADDLRLITSVQQTCDLQAVHLAVEFSCHFTLKDIQDRWFALLYDPLLSRLAQQAIKSLPADVVKRILREVLWSRAEQNLLADVAEDETPPLSFFEQLLDDNTSVFHKSRTPRSLQEHWLLLRHYQLLNTKNAVKPAATTTTGVPTTVSEMEARMLDDQIIASNEEDVLKQETSLNERAVKREMKKLEYEIPHWELLLKQAGTLKEDYFDEFKDDDLAVLKGRILKYRMTKEKLLVGRGGVGYDVDVDLKVEGPCRKISRKHCEITYSKSEFTLQNIGKIPMYVNGEILVKGSKVKLLDNSVIEVYCLKFLFNINPSHETETVVGVT